MARTTLLIADPSGTTRKIIRAALEGESLDIYEASTSDETIALALKHRPNIITLSMMIGPSDGVTVCGALHALDELAATSVVMVTSRDDPDEMRRAFEAGAIRFLSKKSDVEELKMHLAEVLTEQGIVANTRILAVDDSPTILSAIARALTKEGATVYTAQDGEAALALLAKHSIDVVLTDYHMPKLDGLGLVKEIRRNQAWSTIPVLFLSATENNTAVVRALKAGATDFVRKPFDATELMARVGSLARLAAMTQSLKMMATTDELTGLVNRREGLRVCQQHCAAATRYATPFSCLMMDVDKFKGVNDTYGHAAGDAVLREIASVVGGVIRESDVLCRVGGEEFLVILPHVGLASSVACAEKIRTAVADHRHEFDGEMMNISVSIGAAAYEDGQTTVDEILRSADTALYAAKESGRNRVHAMVAGKAVPGLSLLDYVAVTTT